MYACVLVSFKILQENFKTAQTFLKNLKPTLVLNSHSLIHARFFYRIFLIIYQVNFLILA